MERQKFEDSWKKAFDGSEISPSENVWTNIELELEKAKGLKLQKRLKVYQWLTAASVIFTIGIGIGTYIFNKQIPEAAGPIASQTSPNLTKEKAVSGDKVQEIQSEQETVLQATTDNHKHIAPRVDLAKKTTALQNEDLIASTNSNSEGQTNSSSQFFNATLSDKKLPTLVEINRIKVIKLKQEEAVDPVAMMLAKLQQREDEIKDKKKDQTAKRSETLWTSVSFAAGAFNTVNTTSDVSPTSMPNASALSANSTRSSGDLATKTAIAEQQARAPGVAYSVGLSLGTKLAKRWVLQGGVNYLNQSTNYTAESAVSSADFTSFRPASINELGKLAEGDAPAEEKLVTTAPYNVNNNLRYLSVPLQAGYLVINRDFGLQLNAGVATDLFLQNTVVADGRDLDKSTSDRGDSSPYRSVNLSGLAGTELSYRFSRHYRLSLNPGVRYPLNSIYKSELGVQATPLTFDVGLKFRYIFN